MPTQSKRVTALTDNDIDASISSCTNTPTTRGSIY